MQILNQEFTQEIMRLTRNPAFMAIAIGLIWLIRNYLLGGYCR